MVGAVVFIFNCQPEFNRSDTVLSMAGVRGKTFSGLRIDGLTIGRIANKTSVPVFSAVSCRNKGRHFSSRDVVSIRTE